MIILIHTSKTMRSKATARHKTVPELLEKAIPLHEYVASLSINDLMKTMKISEALATKTKADYKIWNTQNEDQTPASLAFLGDIYSGLQAQKWDQLDLVYAEQHLRILSGLYGILRPSDGVMPYRLEMGYRFRDESYRSLYNFWGDLVAKTLPNNVPVVNLAAVEYSKTVTDYIDNERVISPSFLTVNPRTGKPTFVVVHAKIARGAFASWMVTNKIKDISEITKFSEIGYKYSSKRSKPNVPVFVAQDFGGIGLSVRLKK